MKKIHQYDLLTLFLFFLIKFDAFLYTLSILFLKDKFQLSLQQSETVDIGTYDQSVPKAYSTNGNIDQLCAIDF